MSTLSHVLADMRAFHKQPQPPDPLPLRAPIPRIDPKRPEQSIRNRVCAKHNVSIAELNSTVRDKRFVDARRELAKELREMGWALQRIGDYIGKRHHTTAMNWLKEDE